MVLVRNKERRRGTILILLFIVTTVIFIVTLSLAQRNQGRRTLTFKARRDLEAYYAALGAIDLTLMKLRNLLESPLVFPVSSDPKVPGQVNAPLLDLLHYDRARDWARTFHYGDGEVVNGATCTVHAELVNVTKNEFYTFIDRVERGVPDALEKFREQKDVRNDQEDVEGSEELGGWSGQLRLTAIADIEGTQRVLETVRGVKVVDISAISPDHTLFIESKQPETLGRGRFLLSNLDLPKPVADLLQEMTWKVNEMLGLPLSQDVKDVVGNVNQIQRYMTTRFQENEMADALQLIHDMASKVEDEKIKDKVDSIILSLNPRNWGRVRSNGSLYVKLPFFATDDIINYFADDSIFGHQRPEVGYLYHDNRLHDPYLGVYTHFEGLIYRQYRRLNPLSMGPSTEPKAVQPQRYTINTQFNYVDRHPERKEPENRKRLTKHVEKVATNVYKETTRFEGTHEEPIEVDGIWFFKNKLEVGGVFTGKGMLVAKEDITLLSSMIPLREDDSVNLVSLRGAVKLNSKFPEFSHRGGMYAHNGVRGGPTQSLDILGNLVVNTLRRDDMPRYFTCRFDSSLKNHMADNIKATISRRYLSYRERAAHMRWEPLRVSADPEDFLEQLPPEVDS